MALRTTSTMAMAVKAVMTLRAAMAKRRKTMISSILRVAPNFLHSLSYCQMLKKNLSNHLM